MDKLTLKIEYTDFLNNDLENYLKEEDLEELQEKDCRFFL